MIMHNEPMKRTLLALLLVAPVALTGCQTLHSINPFHHHAPEYNAAQQERPLEVPPGLDQPPTAEALTIPGADANGATGAASTELAASSGFAGNTLSLADTPDSAYRRVGLALERGAIGQVTAHDDAAHTYQIAVDTVVTKKSEGGFIHRLFHHAQNERVQGTVTISVEPSGSGSVVSAQGDRDAVSRIMLALQQRLK